MSRNPERTAALGLIWGAFPEHIARRLLLAIASPAVLAEFEELAATRHARALLDKGIMMSNYQNKDVILWHPVQN